MDALTIIFMLETIFHQNCEVAFECLGFPLLKFATYIFYNNIQINIFCLCFSLAFLHKVDHSFRLLISAVLFLLAFGILSNVGPKLSQGLYLKSYRTEKNPSGIQDPYSPRPVGQRKACPKFE